jgi:hypothetical protein
MIDPTERRYGDREVRLILKSATELQRRATDDGPGPDGMSLAELEQVASEAGIDPVLVRRAAAQLDAPRSTDQPNRFLGAPTEVIVERTIDVALDPGMFDEMLDVVRASTRQVGEVSTVGRQFGWKGRLDGAKSDVSISAGESRTTLRVRVALDEVALGHFMIKGMMAGGAGGLLGATLLASVAGAVAPFAFLAIAGGAYTWARRGFGRSAGDYRRRAIDLVDALAARAGEVSRSQKLSP